MAFLKKAAEKMKDLQSTSIEKFGEAKANSGGAANNQGRFIIRNPVTAQLEVEGTGEVVRFASLCAPDLFDSEGFEKEDTMRTIAQFGKWPVTRTYTLKVKSTRIGKGHINGWDPEVEDFHYDELWLGRHKLGGNFTDLIRHRRGCRRDGGGQDWWRDEECLDSMKKIVSFLLNRVNTITGIRIGDDPTILAFETGNEMNCGGLRPAPGDWTLEIARHIKNLAPRALVMDGSFAPGITTAMERNGGLRRMSRLLGHTARYSSAAYGFFAHAKEFESFLKHCDRHGASGTLAWSLRPHSVKGGFKTHGEGNEIWSYHAPGWKPTRLPDGHHHEWDHRERDVIRAIRKAAFDLTNQKPPPIQPNHPPELLLCKDGKGFTWRGVAWADYYELWTSISCEGDQDWKFFQGGLTDNIKEGHLKYCCNNILKLKNCSTLWIAMRGISADKLPGPFSKPLRIGC
ncbi:hypothetical protein PSHT_16074 [Puccinia striiformis]|uniref:mannan endo-1,4-beta-mannosidase n=1 Tax=Puccinia striiformis TaxID=27350 RepID=A0A2S4UBM2_9BASI|nr:hypothetical protein PSHT_16074 [Puccinia striiformis]